MREKKVWKYNNIVSDPTKAWMLHSSITLLTGLLLMYGYSITTGPGIDLYHSYANNFLLHVHNGQISFGGLPVEYPILSLVPMLIPLIVGNALYDAAFIFLMLVVAIGIYMFLYYCASKSAAFAYMLYTTIGGFGIALGRFDLIIGSLVLVSLYEAERKNYYIAYLFLAIATMFKLVPLLLVVPLFMAEQRDKKKFVHNSILKKYKGIALYAAVCLIIFTISVVIGEQDSLSPILFGYYRPIQIESIPASILVLFAATGMVNVCVGADFASVNIYGVRAHVCNAPHNAFYTYLTQGILLFMLLLFMSGLVYLAKMFIKEKLSLAHFYLGVLLVFLVTNKVFSPQYFLWVFPLFAYIYRFDKVWIGIVSIVAFLTTLIYPFLYGGTILVKYLGTPMLLHTILIRNILFVAIVYIYFFNIFNVRMRKSDNKRFRIKT